jgi:WD40 repeat protein
MNSLCWSNLDDTWLLTSSLDKSAKIWDSKTGKLVCELAGRHTESLTAAVFSADDTQVITTATDKLIILWEIRPNTDGSDGHHAVVMTTIETKCYLDLAISSSRIVAKG